MKSAPVILPHTLRERFGANAPQQLMAIGNTDLLHEPLIGLIASRECPGHVLLQTLELATQWAPAQQVVLLDHYRVPPDEQAAMASGHLLVLSASPPGIARTTRAQSLARHRWVLAMSGQHCIPYLSPTSPIRSLIATELSCVFLLAPSPPDHVVILNKNK